MLNDKEKKRLTSVANDGICAVIDEPSFNCEEWCPILVKYGSMNCAYTQISTSEFKVTKAAQVIAKNMLFFEALDEVLEGE